MRLALLVVTIFAWLGPCSAFAQFSSPDSLADAALTPPVVAEPVSPPQDAQAILELFLKGGWLMAPIGVMSVVVLAIAAERMLGLRRGRVRPRRLQHAIQRQVDTGELDPQLLYNTCRRNRSVLSRVVTATLAKGGRPHAEVEAAADDALQNEADQMYSNVRTLNLAAAVTPLMGLLGTVWGMIQSFFVTANAAEGTDKATALAEGIYVALMTTFAGLAVAIPAAVLAHYFEGRILQTLRRVESLMTALLPRIESLESGERLDLRLLEAEYQAERRGGRRRAVSSVASAPPPLSSSVERTVSGRPVN